MLSRIRDLIKQYREGLPACTFDQREHDKLMSSMPNPLFGDAAPRLTSGTGKKALLHNSVLKYIPDFGKSEPQGTGDCFVSGTRVRMWDNTWKNVEDIIIGDIVLSHSNNPRKVLSLVKKKPSDNKIREINLVRYKNSIKCTNDHLILVKNENGLLSWKSADQISSEDYVLLPSGRSDRYIRYPILDMGKFIVEEDNDRLLTPQINKDFVRIKGSKKKINRFIEIDTDIGWLLGIFYAEGGINDTRVDFSTHKDEKYIQDKICFIIKNKFGIDCKLELGKNKKNVTVVRCGSKLVVSFFKNFSSGNVWTKSTQNLEKLPKNVKLEIVRGWVDGDGCFNKKRTRIAGTSVSKKLIQDLSSLLIDCNIQHSVNLHQAYKHTKENYTINIYSKQATAIFPECFVSTATNPKIKVKQQKLDKCEYGLLAKVKSNIETDYSEDVYCIEVEEEHSFIANGIAVHNCSSHACRNVCDTSRIMEIVSGDNEDFYLRGATEGIYGSRGYSGQGMSIDATVRFVNQTGGILVRQKYGDIDLSKYNPNLAIRWGSTGVPSSLLQVAKKNQVQQVANISTIQEAKDALFNGYAISVGSNIGFSQTRDKNGMSRREGSWNHAMACISYDDTKTVVNKCIFLIQNSWGLWNSGPKLYDQPDGSFWITEDDFYSMIAQRQAWVFSNVVGFPPQNVKWTIGEVF